MEKISFKEKVNVISVLGRVMDRKNLIEEIRGREKAKDLETIEKALRFYLRNTEVQEGIRMNRKTYYEVPTQVKFWVDEEGMGDRDTHVGIAYHNRIICACCGGIFLLDDDDKTVEILKEMDWIDFSEYIDD